MKLSYRGISYDYNPPVLATSQGKLGGKYRGLDWRFRNMKKQPVLQPNFNLKYRGVYYQTGVTQNSAQTAKTPAESVQDKARSLMLTHQRALINRQRSMLNRSAAEVGLVPNPA